MGSANINNDASLSDRDQSLTNLRRLAPLYAKPPKAKEPRNALPLNQRKHHSFTFVNVRSSSGKSDEGSSARIRAHVMRTYHQNQYYSTIRPAARDVAAGNRACHPLLGPQNSMEKCPLPQGKSQYGLHRTGSTSKNPEDQSEFMPPDSAAHCQMSLQSLLNPAAFDPFNSTSQPVSKESHCNIHHCRLPLAVPASYYDHIRS